MQYSKDKRLFSIENVDIWHNSAVVKVIMIIKHPERIYECTDYLSLLKKNDQWKIYCKLWSARNIPIDK
ncbi:MAG: nuclear transport factor 2 family protein [Candidatus Heimdallarchaeota archaeon]|nr:nuclear transport factor 2 family protein [Candidatus Heimdallarchaeota archaeon]MCK4876279.1 nuclear transport factor 2 family protein [Candidatus Heimdallarchaeota archaeon]